MSLRKISDLEGLTISEEYDKGLSNNVQKSLFEISYLQEQNNENANNATYAFKSMYVRYGEVKDDIIGAILCSDTCVVFNDPVVFNNPVTMLCGLELSGDLCVNSDIPLDENPYVMYVNMHSNTFCAFTTNTLHAEDTNIIQAPNNIICSLTQTLADFHDEQIDFYVPLSVNGDITANNFHGVALCARWADLAELYESDYDYEPGTLVKFGGSKEITIADNEVNAVITTSPGLMLGEKNDDDKILKGIALVGRVPVNTIGKVQKFDNLYLSKDNAGIATSNKDNAIANVVVGKALESSEDEAVKKIESVVKLQI